MSETYPLTQARTKLGELVSRARFTHERVVLTDHGKPVAAIISMAELDELQRAQEASDIAEAQAIVAQGGPKIPNRQVAALLEVDDATYADLIAALRERGGDGIPDEEFMAMVRTRAARHSA
jgi:prevent-host-death family protein